MIDFSLVEKTAILLRALLEFKNMNKARLSTKTLEELTDQPRIYADFITNLTLTAPRFGLSFSELNIGGFGIALTKPIAGAKAITYDTFENFQNIVGPCSYQELYEKQKEQ